MSLPFVRLCISPTRRHLARATLDSSASTMASMSSILSSAGTRVGKVNLGTPTRSFVRESSLLPSTIRSIFVK